MQDAPEHFMVLKSSNQEVRYVNVFAPPSNLDDDKMEVGWLVGWLAGWLAG